MTSIAGAVVRAFVGLGSNLVSPIEQLEAGLQALRQLPETQLVRSSSLYRTAPIGMTDQPDFYNAVAEIETRLSAPALLQHLLLIEQRRGRVRAERNGPRTLDLDLLLFGESVVRTNDLEVPHPRMHERAFVMVPLAEIAPNLQLRDHGLVRDLAANLRQGQRVERWSPDATA